jgi:hypothetical protein
MSSSDLPEALGYLRWSAPKLVQYSPADLRALADDLARAEGAFFLVGDCSPLYAITGKPSILPALWFHPGLTFPSTSDARFGDFEDLLLERLEHFAVRRIVIEPRVWVGDLAAGKLITLESFPRVHARVESRKASERAIGPFRVIELAP